MKHILLAILLISFTHIASAEDQAQESLSSPQATMKTFMKAMVKIKNDQGITESNYTKAISTFNINPQRKISDSVANQYADQLIRVIDKIKLVKYDQIPLNIHAIWYFDKRVANNKQLEISISKFGNYWLFTPDTFSSLDDYLDILQNNKNIEGITTVKLVSDQIRGKLSDAMLDRGFLLENWQWPALLIILIIAFFFQMLVQMIVSYLLNHYSKLIQESSNYRLQKAIRPLSKMIFFFTVMKFIPLLDFSIELNAIVDRSLIILMSFMSVWLAHRIIDLLSYLFTQKAQETETKFDDILIPLITKTAFVVTYVIGALVVLKSFTIDITSLIAGLGIGGLAFAFAAKDTLANFFGSIMLVLDRPFDIGDIITAGDIEGVVDEVGFRSTRIRTFNDSVITISNGELMNRSIDNKGKRRFRRLVTTLGVEYDTPPAKIEAFCEGVRQIILEHRWTKKDSFFVYFSNFGDSSLNIELKVSWETEDYARELAERHRLLIDILRLAKELEIGFAFPTQTVHLFNEAKVAQKDLTEKYFEEGIEKAKKVVEKPLTLKNPRSNGKDKEQFGDNDIGL